MIRLVLWIMLAVAGCRGPGDKGSPPLFERLPETVTGITFRNVLEADTTRNIFNYLYYYDGGGVAAGDVNGDGFVDIYFTANQLSNSLYLNRGGFVFEDVTEDAGVAGPSGWTKGVTMADVNGDGRLDIYVSMVESKNSLYINRGDGSFTEEAAAYGLARDGLSTQATFFDYDADGDLDVYLVHHSLHDIVKLGGTAFREERHSEAGDQLLRNDNGHFTDVSEQAGIYGSFLGYGLAAMASDLNGDGCLDLYISNDFHENDYLYYNNCDGTFREAVYEAMGHTSLSSMGSDAADINNDGRIELVVVDMLPARTDIMQTVVGAEAYDVYRIKLNRGYHHQFTRNTLQLNMGGERFADIAFLAGVAATDWSWAPLLADFDNDGFTDLFVTNGIYRRPNDRDYLDYAATPVVQQMLLESTLAEQEALLDRMPQVPLSNYAFRNSGELIFEDRTAAWGLSEPGFSNGAAYADLDNDGDLDIVVNNLGDAAAIYRNNESAYHALTIALAGAGGNTQGIGARVTVVAGGMLQIREQIPSRGWQSSVDPRLHVGLGAAEIVDTLRVVWPGGKSQTLTDIPANQLLMLHEKDAEEVSLPTSTEGLFRDASEETLFDYTHEENSFIDFTREPLMPHLLSAEGPALAVGDVNGDGLDDVYAGGAKWQSGRLFVQQNDGQFLAVNDAVWKADSLHEDVDAAFFDADSDGDADLYVVSAGNEFWGRSDALRDRLYLNDGDGTFIRMYNALPEIFANGCCVRPADVDKDGDVDIFVGGRVVARSYGTLPQSVLLQNRGDGTFVETTTALSEAGMVTDAVWTDYDGNGELDLIVVGEWSPVRIFAQVNGHFMDATGAVGLEGSEGWWNGIQAHDMDGDGDADLMLGNMGRNSVLQPPVRLTLGDFNQDGRTDPLLTFSSGGKEILFASRDELFLQLPHLAHVFPTYALFAGSTLAEVLTPEERGVATIREVHTFDTSYAENRGDGTFVVRPLPLKAQMAPVRALLPGDYDHDGHTDILLAGNLDGMPPRRGRYDASYGWFVRGDGAGGFEVKEPLWIEGSVRAIRPLRHTSGELLLVARNNAPLQAIRLR